MNRKIWKALGIVVCMLALAAPHAMAETITHMVTADTDFAKVVKNINASGVDDENVIELCADITLTGNHTLKRSTTIKSKDEDRKISINGSNAGITVAGEKTVLNLGAKGYDKKLTIEGDGDANIQAAFVTVSEGATANMYENVTLQNRKSMGNACVVIMGSDSVFNMYGGVIKKCSRAVIADSGATVRMLGGKIEDCEVRGDGVILVYDNSKFIMEGGTISECEAPINNGGGLYADNSTITISNGAISGCKGGCGGGLYAKNSSTITISGGTISECEASTNNGGGLYADNSTINISGGTISGCKGVWGGGLYAENSSTIEISGGAISGCTVGAGGGLFVDRSTVRISGGIISGCITSDTGNGGGLYANHSTIKITGGRIENNKAAHGGGVALIGKTTFEKPITNWTVIGNEAYATGGVGGGIKLENGSMDVSAGSNRIYNNTAGGQGADIFLLNDSSTIKLPNAANMNATYRDSGIEIDGWYNDNPPYTPSENGVGVDVSGELTGGLSLVASYKTILVRIEIDVNGGVGGSGSQTVQKGKSVILEAPTKEGHLFTGWKDEKGNSYPAGADGKVNITVTEDMTLTAEWKKLPSALVRIEIDANGGVGGSGSQTVQKGTTVTLEAPTKEGHLFTGWKDEKGNSYPAGADGKVNITVNEDMKLTAVWEARTFTVTYVLLDGKTRTETVAYGQKLTLGEEPRTGYTFVGWKDGEKMYHAGETITVTEDKTLTAVWDTRSFTVTYVLLNGKTRTETAAYGQNVTLGEEPRTGYTFVGWKDGEKMYHAGETITVTEDMTLTAEWEKLPSAENLPKTGDESPVLLWSVVLAVSAAAGFMLKRKK
ncbi:MAG: InlB B-repeat-containing protein [Christensenellales bacterium]|nr:InlB B-repeat-containing protein [Christensenellales bacterium]